MGDPVSPSGSQIAAPAAPSESGIHNNNQAAAVAAATSHDNQSTTPGKGKGKTSVGGSTDRKRRRKRQPKKPEDYTTWTQEDQTEFNEVTKMMKHWKATQRQCLPVISNVGRFKSLKQKMKPDEIYKQEVKEYEESIKNIPKIAPEESFDYESRAIAAPEPAAEEKPPAE